MALILTATLIRGPFLWGLGMAFTGVLLGLAGMDVASGALRFTFGIPDMADDMDFVVVAMGLFAFAEIISQLGERETQDIKTIRIESLMPNRKEMRDASGAILRGTGVGSVFGILPGAGMTIASFAAYMLERSEEHTSELQSLMRISYAVFCLKKKKITVKQTTAVRATPTTKTHNNTIPR